MKKNKLTGIIIVIGVALIFVGVVFGYQKKAEEKELADFVPKDAMYYVEFNKKVMDENLFVNQSPRKNLFSEWVFKNGLPRKAMEDGSGLLDMGLVGTNLGGIGAKVWLLKFDETEDKEKLVSFGDEYFYEELSPKILGVSYSKHALQKVKTTSFFGADKSWGMQLPRQEYFVRAFFDSELLSQKLDMFLGDSYGEYLQPEDKMSFLGLKLNNDNQVSVYMDLPLVSNLVGKIDGDRYNKFLKVGNTFQVGEVSGESVISFLKSDFEKSGILSWDELLVYIEKKYDVNLDIMNTFFKQHFLMLVRPTEVLEKIKLFNSGEMTSIVLIGEIDNDLDKNELQINLENFVRRYLAFRFPSEREKILPDGTKGIELVADTDKIYFENKSVSSGTAKCVRGSESSFCYGVNEGNFFLSDSFYFLNQAMSASQYSEEVDFEKGVYEFAFDPDIFGGGPFNIAEFIFLESSLESSGVKMNGLMLLD